MICLLHAEMIQDGDHGMKGRVCVLLALELDCLTRAREDGAVGGPGQGQRVGEQVGKCYCAFGAHGQGTNVEGGEGIKKRSTKRRTGVRETKEEYQKEGRGKGN